MAPPPRSPSTPWRSFDCFNCRCPLLSRWWAFTCTLAILSTALKAIATLRVLQQIHGSMLVVIAAGPDTDYQYINGGDDPHVVTIVDQASSKLQRSTFKCLALQQQDPTYVSKPYTRSAFGGQTLQSWAFSRAGQLGRSARLKPAPTLIHPHIDDPSDHDEGARLAPQILNPHAPR